ncbi:MarR family winged helix-turn-helix transcriptional regulator [Gottfriedia sp. NPDC057991]|uniref:MarR family winged helix-turn-helix transcriptional regulator n=1 Tax=Gottfriedia sp. NPDC057991 TaxID=3346298 RepID=UPI0036D9E7D9
MPSDKANTYLLVVKLEKKGLVERQPNPNDRRASNVVLTEEGRTLFDEVFPKQVPTISQNL